MPAWKKYMAEMFGTFVLTLMGCGAAVLLGTSPSAGYLPVALAFGLSIVAMAYVIGGVSGCHINPAVSLGMLINRRITGKDFCGYVIFQILGAVLAGALLFALVNAAGIIDMTGGLGSNGITNAGGLMSALIIEVILTAVFVLTVLGVTGDKEKSPVAGIVIGLTLTFVHIIGIALTGTSVNPARSIGPAIFAGGEALDNLWVFILAPLVGAILAALIYKIIGRKNKLHIA